MKKEYSHPDYFRVLAALREFNYFVEENSNDYIIRILPFEEAVAIDMDENLLQFNEEPFKEESLKILHKNSLITCTLFFKKNDKEPLFTFFMQENYCQVDFYLEFLDLDGTKFDGFIPAAQIIGEHWESVLTFFINKVKIMMKIKLKFDMGINPSTN